MEESWQIDLLGGLRAYRNGHAHDRFRTRKAGALLAYLAYYPRPHAREVLIETLWPEHAQAQGRNSLRVILSSLRRLLEPPDVPAGSIIVADRLAVGLNARRVTTDVALFESALQAASEAQNDATYHRCLMVAVERYRGALLPGHYEDWIVHEEQRLEESFTISLRQLVRYLENEGDTRRAIEYALHGVSAAPLREELHHDLMRLYAACGQHTAALRQYQVLNDLLHRHLGTLPAAATRELLRHIENGSQKTERQEYQTESTDHNQNTSEPTRSTPQTDGAIIGVATQPFHEAEPPQARPPQALPPALRTAHNVPHVLSNGSRLPPQWTRFFGREEELAQLSRWLQACHDRRSARVMTITGPGGCGKTRLAVEAVRAGQAPSSEILLFVPLADLAGVDSLGPDVLAEAILSALRSHQEARYRPEEDISSGLPSPGLKPLERLVDALSAQPALLLLDTFEHLLPWGASLVQFLLARVPSLSILVASQQVLQIEGERELSLSPLLVPESAVEVHSPGEILRYAGAQLFHDRAQTAHPNFRVTRHNARTLAKLCMRLEGLPLAIELCAARAGQFTASQMLARLEDRLNFLSEQPPSSTYHHPTLRAALEWSYDLLWPELQRFFARLCVFRGGFSGEAAIAVTGEPRALHYLAHLRACSLLTLEQRGDGARFNLLDTLREFTSERLSPQEYGALQQRHAEYYQQLAADAAPHLTAPQQGEWLNRLETERDNFRVALEWMAKNDAHACLRLATMLGRFWLMRGHYAEGRYWLETALYGRQPSRGRTQLRKSRDRVRLEHDQPALFGAALGMAAEIAWYSGDFIAAQTFGEQRLTIARRSGDIGIVADALSHLGYAMTQQGQYEKALPMLEESLALSRQLDDKPRVVAVLLHLSGLASVQGDFSSTRTLGEEALAFARELGDQHSIAVALNTIGFAACLQGDLAQARPWLEESLEAFQKVGEKWHTSRARWTLGHLARAEGDLVGAHAIFTGELASMREWDSKWPVPYHLEPLAYMAIDAGRHELAACLLGAAQALREASHPLHPALRREYEHHLSALQGALDEPAFAAAWAAGRALSAEAALDYALQETTP